MNALRALWWKEARDRRPIVATCAALYLALLVGAKLALGAGFDANLRIGWIHPIALVVVAAALAAEALAHDVVSGVDTALARLPVSRPMLWLAKASLVTGALTVFELFALAVEHAFGAFEPPADTARLTPLFAWWLAASLVVASVVAAASILRRTLPAALVGVGVPLFVGWLLTGTERPLARDLLGRVAAASGPGSIALVVALALAASSLAAYSLRRFDRLGLRRVAGFAAAGLCVAAPALGWALAKSSSCLEISPGVPGAEIRVALPSPGGRFVALLAERTCKLDGAWRTLARESWLSDAELSRMEVWIVDRASGTCREIPDERLRAPWTQNRRGWSVPAWTSDGRLLTVSSASSFGGGAVCYEVVDPRTALVVESLGDDTDALDRAAGVPPRWYALEVGPKSTVISLADGTKGERVPTDAWITLSPEVGVYFVRNERDELVRRDLADGSERALAHLVAGFGFRPRVSPDGRWIALQERDSLSIRDARDGALVFGPEKGVLIEWSSHGRIATIGAPSGAFALSLDGSRVPAPPGWPSECGDDGWVTHSPAGVEWHSADGTRTETIYATP